MANLYDKNQAISAEEAFKIVPRAEFRVFGKDIIGNVKEHMWSWKATLYAARVMPAETYFLSRGTNKYTMGESFYFGFVMSFLYWIGLLLASGTYFKWLGITPGFF